MIRHALLGALALILTLAAALAYNTLRQGSRQLDVPPLAALTLDEAAAAARLGEAVRLRTVSSIEQPALNADQFRQLHDLLTARFPRTHATLKRETVGDLSLLYTWQGRDPQARPILLMAHQDVVPIATGTEEDWQEAPFSGAVKDGFVWGRGAWDDKGNLMAQMEAVETLVASGYQPARTVYLAYGADEEVGGRRGAARIAAHLKARGVRLDWVLDEGLLITYGIMPGLDRPAALIGIAEKGYLSVDLTFSAAPGHASMPPARGTSAIAMMSAALTAIEHDRAAGGIRGVAEEMFATIAPEMRGFSRVALSNLWLFGPLVQKQLEAGASTRAMLQTTAALTMAHAGIQDNVLPGRADATVNFRLLPGDSTEQVMARLTRQLTQTLGDGKFAVSALPNSREPSPVAPTDSPPYRLINRTIREVFPGTLVAPGLMIAATDSLHFGEISEHIFKFSPVRATLADLARFHGTNERIAVTNYGDVIRFYHRLLTAGTQGSP